MYKRELKYIVLEYYDNDLAYIDDLCTYIEKSCDEIVRFFGINEFGTKVNVKLWNNLDNFRGLFKNERFLDENGEVYKWICGFANENTVHTLCLEQFVKTKSHEKCTLQDLKYTIMHEFTHSCHSKVNKSCYAWLGEGLATTITHQYENVDRIFNFTLEQALYGGTDYRNYYTMFSYVYEKYGRDYILNLIKDNEMLKKETPKLYKETFEIYGNIKKNNELIK